MTTSDTVLFLGWNRPVPGRETQASELFQSCIAYLGKQQKQGNIDSFEPVFLGTHGGDLNGFVIIRGTKDKLHNVRYDEDFQNLNTQCAIALDGFGVISGFTGEGVQRQLKRWQNYITK